ncbi:hypothetical protein [Pectobacterium punjabense]|uniref:Uncharacterized protein n=1 Tax=Pectobacterium punjabense TaxID=2108399 RepID=A0ABX6KZ69_9GAMM|nr:hypothetical protein [Pectobacterium punjabense]MBS4430663.1 hypothetical protein [Pectobacterium punjabense]PTA64046.1 hypothetical protein C9I36_11665 [Pectobacterium punjabense]QJA18847.1 hypothetical protein E2566_02270 [Pectobacterium punjabense]
MAGFLFFSKNNGVSLGSSAIDIMADYLRPYMSQISKEIMEEIYETYDFYDQTLDFSKLSKSNYMQCYRNIEKAIEIDLKANPVINNRPQDWIFKAWYEEIKPKMQDSPLYDPNMLDK